MPRLEAPNSFKITLRLEMRRSVSHAVSAPILQESSADLSPNPLPIILKGRMLEVSDELNSRDDQPFA